MIPMQYYKSVRVAVVTWTIDVNTHKHTNTMTNNCWPAVELAQPAEVIKIDEKAKHVAPCILSYEKWTTDLGASKKSCFDVHRAGLRHKPTRPWPRVPPFQGPRNKQSKKMWCIFAHNDSITGIKRRSGILSYN